MEIIISYNIPRGCDHTAYKNVVKYALNQHTGRLVSGDVLYKDMDQYFYNLVCVVCNYLPMTQLQRRLI